MNASDLMTRDPLSLPETATIGDAMAMMTEHHVRHVPIVRGAVPVAMLSDRDLRSIEGVLASQIGGAGSTALESPVSVVAHGPPITALATAPLRDPIDAMLAAHVSSVLVVDAAGALVGIITSHDVLGAARDAL